MVFNSLAFAIFLPIVLIGYYLLPYKNEGYKWQNRFLLLASLVFYAWWDWRFLGLLGLTVVVDYYASHKIAEDRGQDGRATQRSKLWLKLSIGCNLAVLAVFKYLNFGVATFGSLLHTIGFQVHPVTLQLALPIGISFYTFMSMAYVIDVYRGEFEPVKDFFDFALFVSYFPHLVAGPILRAHQLLPQLTKERTVTIQQIRDGLALILIGLVRKVLIADILSSFVDEAFRGISLMTSADLLLRMWLFTIQIYGDFAGYSDIARGVSKLFGIELHVNFATPFLSQNMTELWRRWHISLSSWLRDYVYIPLGGSRKGEVRTYINNFATMLISGLWHGASWTFVGFGAVNGIGLAIHKAWLKITGGKIEKGYATPKWNIWSPLKVLMTINLYSFSLLLFRTPDFPTFIRYLKGMLAFNGGIHVGSSLFVLPFILLSFTLDIFQYTGAGQRILSRVGYGTRAVAYGVIFALVLIAGSDTSIPFIYFQF
jgi:alginate O-acetyltransferase complex protein AlgI